MLFNIHLINYNMLCVYGPVGIFGISGRIVEIEIGEDELDSFARLARYERQTAVGVWRVGSRIAG